MRKLIITVMLALMPALFYAQSSPFDKFEGKEGVEVVVVNKKMFDLLSSMNIDCKDEKVNKYLKQAQNLDKLKIFATDRSDNAAEIKDTFASYLKKYPFEELMSISDGDSKTKIYVRTEGNSSQIKEVVMLVDGDKEATVFLLSGNITL